MSRASVKRRPRQLLQQFETLDNIYDNLWQIKDSVRRKLEAGKESAEMSKKVAELWFDAPVALDLDEMDVNDLDTAALKDLLTKLEFRSLLRNLPEHMQNHAAEKAGTRELTAVESAEELPSGHAKATLLMAKELVVWPDGDDVWLSHERGKAAKLPRAEAAEILTHVAMVGHDTKVF